MQLARLGFLLITGIAANLAVADVTYNFLPVNTFSGTAPVGTLTATFSDVAGGVQLLITSNLSGTERVATKNDGFFFNIDPADAATLLGNLSISQTAHGVTGFDSTPTLSQGEDAFKADGTGGFFDLNLTWSDQGGFANGQSETLLIKTSVGTIDSSDFSFVSAKDTSGNGGYFAAVHVQNTGANGTQSGWVAGTSTVPEPNSLGWLGFGLAGVAVAVWRTRRA